jgi:hypothetical protein
MAGVGYKPLDANSNRDFTQLTTYYFVLQLISLLTVLIFVVTGISVSFRPGVPSISRILADNPEFAPMIYIIFVILLNFSSSTILFEKAVLSNDVKWVGFLATWIQTVGLIIIPVTNVDLQPGWHIAAICLVVAATSVRIFKRVASRKRCSWLLAMQTLLVLILYGITIAYIISTSLIPFVERTSPIALMEHTIFMLTSSLSIFNIV